MITNNLPLIHAIIDALLFLESAGPDEVNPDSAVKCMENMAASLLTLEESDQLSLRSLLRQIAEETGTAAYKNFVANLADAVGLATPRPGNPPATR